jgi:hypothetical protein
MKRKFFSTLLVGAFFIASMSMFTSCKDYDDDINDLQAQVDKLATAEQLKTSVTDLTAQIAAAKTEAEQKAAAAQTTADAAKTAAATAQATADAAKERVAELEKTGATKAEVAAVQKSLTDAVAQLNTALADKASNADLKAVSDKLDKAIADLDTKATRTELNDAVATINTTISDLQTKLQDVIDTKADKTALADAITKMTAADEELAGKIAKSDAAIAAAQKVAEAAQAAADKAASDAAAALAEAKTELKAAADAAKAAADAAQATADKAATDAKSALDQLDELKKTGASSAELAEAIVAVGKAQAAADAAQAAADAAKSRADAAYDLASKANTTADAAKALAEANALKIQANADSLVSLNAKINALAATVKSLTDADLIKRVTTLESEYEQIQKDFTAIKGAYSTMVTSVNLFTTVEDHMYYWNHRLTFVHVDELDNVFPADKDVADKQYTFKKGQSVTYTDSVLIRVNPATADLKTSNISLINSQGVELGELVKCVDVKPFTQLITRTSAGNGLWVVTFKLNDNYTAEDFEKAVKTDDGRIVYAVAIKNDNANVDANRRVVSEYDLTLGGKNGVQASGDFTVNDVDINEIHNRYFYCDDWTSTENVKELVWTGKPSTTVDEGKNAVDRYKRIDNRQNREILAVVKGEKINISYPTDEPIKGFYVTLDKNFALESAPSEINAWNSYTYENVGKEGVKATMQDGNNGTITIKDMNNVTGDIIGFRVYAVNLDGTLVDPDGRAFYVVVGDAKTYSTIEGSVLADKEVGSESDFIDVTDVFVDGNYSAWTPSKDNKKINNYTSPAFVVKYFDKDKNQLDGPGKDVKYVKFVLENASSYIDGETYKQTIDITKEVNGATVPVKTITAVMTKVMPTAFPTSFKFRPEQEIETGSGKFRAYMIPEKGYDVMFSDYGKKDLNNIFYGLDDNYDFSIAASKKDADKDVALDVTSNGSATVNGYGYPFSIAKGYIDNATEHSITANYLYKGVSTYYDNDAKTWKVGVNYSVKYDKNLTVIYACWHHAEKYAWGTKTVAKKEVSLQPTLQWSATPTDLTTNLADVVAKSSYNNDFFGGTLASLLAKNYLTIKEGSTKLTVDGQVNPYFKATISGNVIKFTQNNVQEDSAPLRDHTENLEFTVIDAYGHEIPMSLPVTVNKPNTAAKRM